MPVELVKERAINIKADAVLYFLSPEELKSRSFITLELFSAAGPKLQTSFARWENLLQVNAAITGAYQLRNTRRIIHAVRPEHFSNGEQECSMLSKSITKAFELAQSFNCRSVAVQMPKEYGLWTNACVFFLSHLRSVLETLPEKDEIEVFLSFDQSKCSEPQKNDLHSLVQSYVETNYIDDSNVEQNNTRLFLEDSEGPSQKANEIECSRDGNDGVDFYRIWQDGEFDKLDEILRQLSPHEREILEKNFGLNGNEPKSIDEIAQEEGIKKEQIRGISAKALRKLRKPSRSRKLMEFLDNDENFIGQSLPIVPVPHACKFVEIPDYQMQDKSFVEMVDWWIEKKGYRMKDFYLKSNLNRAMLSNLRCHPEQIPKKNNAIACAIGLELNLEEATDLLSRAGFSLSKYVKTDVIVEYFIKNSIYDIFTINEELFANDLVLLGTG